MGDSQYMVYIKLCCLSFPRGNVQDTPEMIIKNDRWRVVIEWSESFGVHWGKSISIAAMNQNMYSNFVLA